MRYNIFFLFLFSTFVLNAQMELTSSFNSTGSGRNIAFALSNTFNNRHELGGGLRFNLSKLEMSDDQNNLYKKRLYASNFMQHLGIVSFYHFHIFRDWEHVKPFLFYDLQATYSTTRNRDFLPYMYDINGDVLYKEHVNRFGPFIWIEQNVGFGFKADLPVQFFITQKIGYGMMFILGKEEKLLSKYFDWFAWEFGGLINVGIGYRFKQ